MVKYYKNGFSYYKVDLENNEVTCVTNHPFNRGVVYSFGMDEIAKSMGESFETQLGVVRPGGVVTTETTAEEYVLAKQAVFETFVSASINI